MKKFLLLGMAFFFAVSLLFAGGAKEKEKAGEAKKVSIG